LKDLTVRDDKTCSILKYSKEINFQGGWHIRENQKDTGKVKFIIKGRRIDFTYEYEFKDEEDDGKSNRFNLDDDPKVI
jgi:hypothetical protein